MIINFSPVFTDVILPLSAEVSGSTIVINGETFDFSPLEKGQILPVRAIKSEYFLGPVVRHDDDQLEVTLRLPHPSNASENMRFPQPVTVNKGKVPFPENNTAEEEIPYEPPVVEEVEEPVEEVKND